MNFRGFMRTLAHFRPVEDNEKNKNLSSGEPLNSRTNKLLCECSSNTSHTNVMFLFMSTKKLSSTAVANINYKKTCFLSSEVAY